MKPTARQPAANSAGPVRRLIISSRSAGFLYRVSEAEGDAARQAAVVRMKFGEGRAIALPFFVGAVGLLGNRHCGLE